MAEEELSKGMIAVERDLVVCEKHYDSHFMEFTACPYCRSEKAEAEIAELRADLIEAEWALNDPMSINEITSNQFMPDKNIWGDK